MTTGKKEFSILIQYNLLINAHIYSCTYICIIYYISISDDIFLQFLTAAWTCVNVTNDFFGGAYYKEL